MKELTPSEASMVANAPGDIAQVIEETFWPEIRAVAKGIVEKPRRIKKTPVKQLERVLEEVEKVGGVGAVRAALEADKRKATEKFHGEYAAPVAICDHDGVFIGFENIISGLLELPSRASRSAIRDVLRRLDHQQRAGLLNQLVANSEQQSYRWHIRSSWLPEGARFVVDGDIDMEDLTPKAQDEILAIAVGGSLHRFRPEHIVEALVRGTETRTVDVIIQTMWGTAGNEYIEPVAAAWRAGRFGEVVERNIVRVLAARDVLSDGELAQVAASFLGQSAYMVIGQIPPERGEIVLRNLPEQVTLPDVSEILEGAAARSTWVLCEVVRRGRTSDVSRWMRRNGSSAALGGERGLSVIKAILEHWDGDQISQFCSDLLSHQFGGNREEIRYLALHAPDGVRLLGGTGTLAVEARRHCYQALGSNRRGWDYLRGLLPSWRGSIWQLCRAAEKMTRTR